MLPGGGAEPEATGRVDRHGRLALTAVCEVGHSYVGQEQNRQTSRMLQVPIICHDLNGIPFEYRESCIVLLMDRQIWLQHKNVDRTVNWVLNVYQTLVRKPGGGGRNPGGRTM